MKKTPLLILLALLPALPAAAADADSLPICPKSCICIVGEAATVSLLR